jgi:hypothetical protein
MADEGMNRLEGEESHRHRQQLGRTEELVETLLMIKVGPKA